MTPFPPCSFTCLGIRCPVVPPVHESSQLPFRQVFRPQMSYGQVPAAVQQRGEAGRGFETQDRGPGQLFRSVLCCAPGVQRKNLFDRLLSDSPSWEPRAGAGHPSPHLLQLFGRGELISVALQVQERAKDLASRIGRRRTRTSRHPTQPSRRRRGWTQS